ncbi:MAG: hypothetical protein LBC48_06025 [Dysgonamonadaceae bacterium]|jgi:hypothetical protein|nr:hypothetical protein [Dysgonamonadaceae bacterium]
MIDTKNEYNKRLLEVEMYFDTLTLLDKGSCKITCTDILGNQRNKDIDTNLSTILKANGFLLLYNLVEATVRNSIKAIFNSAHSKNLTFKHFTDNIRKLWIKQEIKNITKDDIFALSKRILENELLVFQAECVNISGNIDAQKIRDIAKQFGFQESKNGRDLVTIKEKRNKLAHGEFTFSEIGKEYTISDLIKYKDSTKNYLDDVLSKIEDYIKNEGFIV